MKFESQLLQLSHLPPPPPAPIFLFKLFSINSLQAELNHILLLRKQLEENLLVNWNLRKVLEDQIKVNKKEGKGMCQGNPLCYSKSVICFTLVSAFQKKSLGAKSQVLAAQT